MVDQLIRVLYIDNDRANIRLINDALSSESSFNIEMASGLEEGLGKLRKIPVDIVLLNLYLPDSQGLDTLKSVRTAAPNKPVVALVSSEAGSKLDFKPPPDGPQAYLSTSELAATALKWSLRCTLECYQAEQVPRESEARLRQLMDNIQEVLILQDARTREMLYVSPAYEKIWGRAVESLYADPASFLNAVRPDDREMLIEAMKNQGEDNLDVQYRIVHPSGEERWIHTRTLPIRDAAGEVYRLAGISEDITEYKRLAMAEHDQRVLAEALRQASSVLTSTLDMTEVLDRILSGIGRVVPHSAADIMLISGGVARVVGSRGYAEQNLEAALLAESYVVEETPHLAYMSSRRQPLIIPDVHHDVTQDQFKPSPAWFWHSYAGVPIRLKDEVLGFINLGSVTPYFFTPVHTDRLEAFAEQAAIAIQNARLHQQAHDLATHQERQRLAHDLHDAVSQTLFSAAITAEALARQWKRNPEKVSAQIDDLYRLTRGALAETRAVLLELRPTTLYELPFETLVQQLVDAAQSRKKLDILTRLDHSDELSPKVKEVFYRVTQEALNNIIKHAQASQVEIRFRWRGGKARLVINDDGQGFDSEQIAPTSLGIGIMRERAERVGAQLTISSVVGEGTQLILNWEEEGKSSNG